MTTKAQQAEQAEALAKLRQWIKPGDTVYCILRHVPRSGMRRVIDFAIVWDHAIVPIGLEVAQVLGYRFDYVRQGVVVNGCGMDMGFYLVHQLGRALFPDGGLLKHSAREAQERSAGETVEKDGGYLLTSRWL